ncbi:hypothetical protein COCCADRAFT_4469 [Bipolaris zeicola 26-R-13]|uniref:DUF7136 domain-containing protein n=1 Tax=Cochliobolus carbonum (strain 26-R-13) TaxID=930089 RepID=W6YF86_COCC2|nr:uncharacterized protein COCCADRAFT_4469 [Bipolaris zeicola 26-R-13]EUC34134.1 hypothetical protein COCCADRAFT_4469 [Bipolaris zeicola 26-R-13]
MRFLHDTSALLCLFGASAFVYAADLPGTVQFDLVFPRNDTIYKPVYPFPVVFGLTNGSVAWPYSLHWSWDIIALDRDQNMDIIIANGDWVTGVSALNKSAPPQDAHLIIDLVIQILNTTSRKLLMRYTFGIRKSCNESTGEISPDPDPSVISHGFVKFGLDPENGDIRT